MESGKRYRVLLAGHHRLLAEGIALLLADQYDVVVATVTDVEQLMAAVAENGPDLIVASVTGQGLTGMELLHWLRHASEAVPVVLLGTRAESAMVRLTRDAGARGYVPKSAGIEALILAIQRVLAGGDFFDGTDGTRNPESANKPTAPELTPRQHTVLNLLFMGMSSKRIASRLKLSVRTVDVHRRALMNAFGVHNGVELVSVAARCGIIQDG